MSVFKLYPIWLPQSLRKSEGITFEPPGHKEGRF